MTTQPSADTGSGRLRGIREENGVSSFRGIPYGASTGGSGRFLPPRPPERWTGSRDALAFGADAPQAAGGTIQPGEQQPQSEHCLVLNVWTPDCDDGKRPVMVWMHGGGFVSGSGSGAWYHGANLARRGDCVVVTCNHRLGALGYLLLSDVDQRAQTANVGLLDVVLSLEWVRDNIRGFGGDPGNVTIFGESGGGRKVAALLAMPAARGLFHKAVIQSGPSVFLNDGSR